MIRSMTGYGRGESMIYNRKFTVEIKSVNHRYNDLTIKMPRVLNGLEDNMRKILTGDIFRGKTDVFVTMDTYSSDDLKLKVNNTLADAYVDAFDKLKRRHLLSDEITLNHLTGIPELFTLEKNSLSETAVVEIWTGLHTALTDALTMFIQMREREGAVLKADMVAKLDAIAANVAKIEQRAPHVVSEYAERLKTRLADFLEGVVLDETRFLSEIVLYADKISIDEEITRLNSHIQQMGSVLEEQESVGRKMDFIVQEMNREANTIGSKSNDIDITRLVLEIKSDVEKIREQVHNIE